MSKFMRGYFTNFNDDSEEHIFIDNKIIPLCNSTEYRHGSFVKTGELNREIISEMCREDSLTSNVSCIKCKRMLKDTFENDFWRTF